MNGLHGIIFAYEKEPGLRELVEHRMPASVPFGGRYRIIDFALSNMHNAGITDVGVVLHGNYQSLLDHLGSGKTWDMSRKYGGLRLLPPFADNRMYQSEEFRGKMEALAGVRSYIEEIRQDYVVLSDSDLIINLPIDDVFEAHLASGAEQPRHVHDLSEQIWYALRGEAVLLLKDGEERPFRTGDVVRFAPGEIHGARNDGTEAFVYLSATSPPQSFDRAYKNRI